MTTPTDAFVVGELPELDELLNALAQSVRLGLRTHVPGRVVTYDPATQLAVVQVELQTVVRVRSLEDLPPGAQLVGTPPNAKAVLPPKILKDIPVVFPGTASAYLTVPITPGVTGTLHVHDRDLTQWLLKGAPCDPLFAWTHILEASEFHPGLHPKTAPIAPATDLTSTVLEGPLVKLGRAALLGVARKTDTVTGSAVLQTWAQAVESALNTLAPGSVATLWAAAAGLPGGLGTIESASTKVSSE